jgi:signal transduction histidine kinase
VLRDGASPPEPDAETIENVRKRVEEGKAILEPPPQNPQEPRTIYVPLIFGEKRLGLLTVLATGAVGRTDLRLLALLGNEAAAALDTARLYEKLRQNYEKLVSEHEALVAECDRLEATSVADRGAVTRAAGASQAAAELGPLLDTLLAELRHPAPALQAMVERSLAELIQGASPVQVAQTLTPARLAAAHLAMILNDLNELADLAAGRVAIEAAPFDAHAIIAEVHHFEGMAAQGKGVRVVLEAAPEPVTVKADPKRLVQMLHHLVVTAVKLSPPGADVELAMAAGGGRLSFSVRDIAPPEHHPCPGLIIARRLAALQGGELVLEGDAMRGTRASFSLALA